LVVKIEVFYSPTCPYCPLAMKMVSEVASQFKDSVKVEEVDTWTPEGIHKAMKYGIQAVPTIVINGKIRFLGVPKSREALAQAIKDEVELEGKSEV
jgi:small redox-active disulfide protein 1